MNIKELRIGNLIGHLGNPVAIESITEGSDDSYISTFQSGIMPINAFQYIPLTEEIFLEFGYVYNKVWDIFHLSECDIDEVGYQKNSSVVFRVGYNGVVCFQVYNDSMSNPQWKKRLIFIAKVDYVHQLQNLYFALTGAELKIKELSNEQC